MEKTFGYILIALVFLGIVVFLFSPNRKINTNRGLLNTLKIEPMQISSPVFKQGEKIPQVYTCQGKNINPPLNFSGVPKQTVSLVLVMDDPDVPKNLKPDGNFDHWVLYSIEPKTLGVAENSSVGAMGKNGTGKTGYTGPCPPDREHRYFFKLFAIDTEINFFQPPTKQELLNAISGHIVAQAELMGRYEKTK